VNVAVRESGEAAGRGPSEEGPVGLRVQKSLAPVRFAPPG
jgi:hypothetical protein